MTTYAVTELDYWSMYPIIKVQYLGTDRDKAIEVFENRFRLNTWDYGKKRFFHLPARIRKEFGQHPPFDKVALYLIREAEDNGKVEIGADWDDGTAEEPIALQLTVSRG